MTDGFFNGGHPMNENAADLASTLIRNFNDVETVHEQRQPLYDSHFARLATGSAARKLGAQSRAAAGDYTRLLEWRAVIS
jgi:hypothetical protein